MPLNSAFTLVFSTPMNTIGLQVPTNFFLYDYQTSAYVAVNRSFNSNGTIAYLNPTSPLTATHEYLLEAANATDLTGNVMTTFSQTFFGAATANTTAPTVVDSNPAGAVNPPTNSVIQTLFNEPVQSNQPLAGHVEHGWAAHSSNHDAKKWGSTADDYPGQPAISQHELHRHRDRRGEHCGDCHVLAIRLQFHHWRRCAVEWNCRTLHCAGDRSDGCLSERTPHGNVQ